MNTTLVLASGFVFMVMGTMFCGVAFYLKSPKFLEKAPIGKIAGTIFYIIGALTFVTGMLAVIFYKDVEKSFIQAGFLAYLIFLTIILFIFVSLLKDTNRHER